MAMKCRLCGKDATQIRGYLARVNEFGVDGIWECRPSCDANLSAEERIIAAIEGEGANTEREKRIKVGNERLTG